MLPFTELPQSVIDELGLSVRIKTHKMLEYEFTDIVQKNNDYNSHLIWCDSTAWYVAHDIYVFQTQNKFEWCYFSADRIFTLQDAIIKLKQLKFNYIEAVKRYKENKQSNRLSKLNEDF